MVAEQGNYPRYKNLPLLCLIQGCSGNLALPRSAFLLKQHVASFSCPSRWIWVIVCPGLLLLPALSAGTPPTHRGEQSPRIPKVSIDAEGTERNVKEMTSAARSSSFPPLPSPSDSRSRGWFVNEELKLIQTERKTDKGCLQAEVRHEKVAVLRRGLNSK